MATTAPLLNAYDHNVFNNLQSPAEIKRRFKQIQAMQKITGVISELFLKHDVVDVFNVALLHRHQTLNPCEAMVETNDVQWAWNFGKDFVGSKHAKYHGYVYPCRWLLQNGRFMPYEFFFTAEANRHEDPISAHNEVVVEFAQLLEEYNLADIIGLGLHKGETGRRIEVTQGSVSMTFPAEDYPVDDSKKVQAAWAFKKEEVDDGMGGFVPKAHVWCVTDCNASEGCRNGYDHDV